MGLKTPLYDTHVAQGAKIIDFGGWDMPLSLRLADRGAPRGAPRRGIFDVSHMCVVDLDGRAHARIPALLARERRRQALDPRARALYSCMLLPTGRRDRRSDRLLHDRVVVPAGRQRRHAPQGSRVDTRARGPLRRRGARAHGSRDARGPGPERTRQDGDAAVAPQRRGAARQLGPLLGAEFDSWFVARTGYTGEDGFEIMLPAAEAAAT